MHVNETAHHPLFTRATNVQQAASSKGTAPGPGTGPVPVVPPTLDPATQRTAPGLERSVATDVLPPEQIDVEGLKKHWGQDTPRYDLDGDGTVGMKDLVALLNQLASDAKDTSSPTTAIAEPTAGPTTLDPATNPAGETSAPTIGESAAADEAPLTVDGLRGAWGTSDERYDLDGDGTVNMADLIALLGQLGEPASTSPELTATIANDPKANPSATELAGASSMEMPVESPTSEPMTLDGLLERWGQDDPTYDFDGDQTIGMRDLLTLLARLSEQAGSNSADALTTEVTSTGPKPEDTSAPVLEAVNTEIASERPMSVVDRLLEQWGSEKGGKLDLDQDGTIGMNDLVQLLSRLGERQDGAQALQATGHERSLNPADGANPKAAARVASALVGQLEAQGYGDHPPSNIHELVDQLRFEPSDRSAVMKNLAAYYENGLGLDFKV